MINPIVFNCNLIPFFLSDDFKYPMNLKGHLPDQEISQLSKLTMVGIFNCNNNKNEKNQITYLISSHLSKNNNTISVAKERKATSPTFYNPPLCLPPQNSFSIHLIFFVAAHHSKGHRLLWWRHVSMVQCTEKSYTRFTRGNKYRTCTLVPWHSAWRKQLVRARENWSSFLGMR